MTRRAIYPTTTLLIFNAVFLYVSGFAQDRKTARQHMKEAQEYKKETMKIRRGYYDRNPIGFAESGLETLDGVWNAVIAAGNNRTYNMRLLISKKDIWLQLGGGGRDTAVKLEPVHKDGDYVVLRLMVSEKSASPTGFSLLDQLQTQKLYCKAVKGYGDDISIQLKSYNSSNQRTFETSATKTPVLKNFQRAYGVATYKYIDWRDQQRAAEQPLSRSFEKLQTTLKTIFAEGWHCQFQRQGIVYTDKVFSYTVENTNQETMFLIFSPDYTDSSLEFSIYTNPPDNISISTGMGFPSLYLGYVYAQRDVRFNFTLRPVEPDPRYERISKSLTIFVFNKKTGTDNNCQINPDEFTQFDNPVIRDKALMKISAGVLAEISRRSNSANDGSPLMSYLLAEGRDYFVRDAFRDLFPAHGDAYIARQSEILLTLMTTDFTLKGQAQSKLKERMKEEIQRKFPGTTISDNFLDFLVDEYDSIQKKNK
jgi:hypothetical protein